MKFFVEDKQVSSEKMLGYMGDRFYIPELDVCVSTLDAESNPILKRFAYVKETSENSSRLAEVSRGCDHAFQIQLIAQSNSLDEFLDSVEQCIYRMDNRKDVVSITDIQTPKNLSIDHQNVNDYMKKIQAGEIIPPIVVDENRKILEGYDSFEAYRQLGEPEVTVLYKVHRPVKLDVVYFSSLWHKYKRFQESRSLKEAEESTGDPEMDKILKDVEKGKAGAVDELTKQMSKHVVYSKGGYLDLRIEGDAWKIVLSDSGLQYDDRKAISVNGKNYWAWQGQSIAVVTQYDPVVGESCNAMGDVRRARERESWINRAGDISFYAASKAFKGTKVSPKPDVDAYSKFQKAIESKARKPINFKDTPTVPIIKSEEVASGRVIPITEPKGGFKSWWAELRADPKYGEWIKQVANLSTQYLGADIASTFMAPVSLRIGYYKGQTAGQYVYSFAKSKGLTWAKGQSDDEVRKALRA